MKFENLAIYNLQNAMRGMRNPMNSWDRGDTEGNHIGDADFELACKLIKAGSTHRKFMRQIIVSVDISASLNWWRHFDTYKVGVTCNACSIMHKILSKPITIDLFEHMNIPMSYVHYLEDLRQQAVIHGDKEKFDKLVDGLPSAYLQKRSVTLNYEVLHNIYHTRRDEKLIDWQEFIDWIDTLPYNQLIKLG